jgi:hypothetical protein
MASPTYQAQHQPITETGIKYFFVSKGPSDVIKAVEYYYSADFSGRRVYNLGFGDYDIQQDKIDDSINTDNGDPYLVFNTVLNTIPMFFESFGDAAIIVRGSDSTDEFEAICREVCEKKSCEEKCRKRHQRIRTYCAYVSREYDTLIKEYDFFGGLDSENGTVIERFIKNKKYEFVLLIKK